MQIIDRYIGRAVISGIVLVTAVLLALETMGAFAFESGSIGNANYSLWSVIVFMLLRMPQQLYLLFPMAALVGTLIGLSMLASNGELTVMRAAGVSVQRIAGSVLKSAIWVMLVVVFIGEVVAPPAMQYAKLYRVKALAGQINLNTDYGLWARDGDIYIHVRRVETDGSLHIIKLYEFDQTKQLKQVISAASAQHDGQSWLLSNVSKYRLEQGKIKFERLASLPWKTLLDPDLVNVVSVMPNELTFWKLNDYIGYLHDNGLDAARYELSFWSKVIAPITICTLIMLAVPFVFGSSRQGGVGQRILIGFMGGMTFYISNRLVGQMGIVYGLPPMLAAMLPTLLVLGLSIYLLTRTR